LEKARDLTQRARRRGGAHRERQELPQRRGERREMRERSFSRIRGIRMTAQWAEARKPAAHELRRTRFGDEVDVQASRGGALRSRTAGSQDESLCSAIHKQRPYRVGSEAEFWNPRQRQERPQRRRKRREKPNQKRPPKRQKQAGATNSITTVSRRCGVGASSLWSLWCRSGCRLLRR
jgi:hypothetical protein